MKNLIGQEHSMIIYDRVWTWHDTCNIGGGFTMSSSNPPGYQAPCPWNEVFSSATEWLNASPLFLEREIENFVADVGCKEHEKVSESNKESVPEVPQGKENNCNDRFHWPFRSTQFNYGTQILSTSSSRTTSSVSVSEN